MIGSILSSPAEVTHEQAQAALSGLALPRWLGSRSISLFEHSCAGQKLRFDKAEHEVARLEAAPPEVQADKRPGGQPRRAYLIILSWQHVTNHGVLLDHTFRMFYLLDRHGSLRCFPACQSEMLLTPLAMDGALERLLRSAN